MGRNTWPPWPVDPFSTIFAGDEPGLWDAGHRFTAVLIAVGVTAYLMGALLIWRSRFALGPFEWILRWITCFASRV